MQRKKSISLTPDAAPPRRNSIADRLRALKPFGGQSVQLESDGFTVDNIVLSSFIVQTNGHQPTERSNHSATLIGDNLIIIGGRDPETDSHFNDVYVLNLQNMTWSRPTTSGDPFVARALHSATLLSDEKTILIIGGATGQSQTDDVVYLNTETWHFEVFNALDGFPGNGVAGHAVAYFPPHEVYVFGGRYTTTGHASADVHLFNTESRTWMDISLTGKALERAGHSATILKGPGGKPYVGVFGGKNTAQTVDEKISVFDPSDGTWSKLETYGKGPSKTRFFHPVATIRSILLFIGGKTDASDEGMTSIYSFDTRSSTWKKIKDRKMLSLNGRYGHSATVHKGNIIIFGGCHSKTSYNDVHIMHVDEKSGPSRDSQEDIVP